MTSNELTVLDGDDAFGHDQFQRIESVGGVEPGHHWFCRKDVEGVHAKHEGKFDFQEGALYLLTRLVFFDGQLHSVELLNDPIAGTESGLITLPLLFEGFEQLTDEAANAFRQQQMLQIQAQAAEVQKEMAEAQVNPALLEPVITAGIQKWERELARANRKDDDEDEPAPRANLPALSTNGQFNLSGAVNHRISPTDIAVFRHMAQREGKIAEIRGTWLTEKVEHLGRILKRLAPFYSEHAAIGMARAHEALGLAKDVEKGLRSLRLYTGEGVTVDCLVEGESAPSSEPLTIYQRKLFMADEFAVWDTVDRMFDYTNAGVFFEALRTNEALRQQLIPAPRGVVAMAVRSTDVDYDAKTIGEAIEAAGRNRANRELFLLVRDGGNWYQVFSDEPSHELAERLFPTRNEMDAIFTGLDGEKIGFEDLRFTHRTTAFDRKSLSYKRFLILACGLDHSKKLFGHFYPEHEALSFISMDFQRKYMRFIADDDSDLMLGDGLQSVHSLISQNHGQLAAGCRVLVFSKNILSERDAVPGAYNNGRYMGNGRTHYDLMVKPIQKAMLLTVRRDKDNLVVSLPVERKRTEVRRGWGRYDPIVRSQHSVKVALNKLTGGNLGYLITDTLRSEELRPYIYSRAQRAHHWDYIYGFKLAMQILGQEEEANAAVMANLESEASVKFGLAREAANIAATSAAQSWRLKNPDADTLPAVGGPDAVGLDFELAEAAYGFTHALPAVEKHIKALEGKLLRVMRGKKGQLIAYYEQPESERDMRVQPWRWVGRRTFTAAGKPTKDAPQTTWLVAGRIVGETELFSVPTELAHRYADTDDLLGRIVARLDMIDEMASILDGAFTGERQGVSDRAWLALTAKNEEKEGRSHGREREFARSKEVLMPVAMDTSRTAVVCIQTKVWDLLFHYGSDAQRSVLLDWGYTLPKRLKDHEGKPIPYEGVKLTTYVDPYCYPSQYIGPVGVDCHISPFRDFVSGPYGYKGVNRLDHSLDYLMSHGPADDTKGRGSWDSTKHLDGALMWMAPGMREEGKASVSRLFPGLATA